MRPSHQERRVESQTDRLKLITCHRLKRNSNSSFTFFTWLPSWRTGGTAPWKARDTSCVGTLPPWPTSRKARCVPFIFRTSHPCCAIGPGPSFRRPRYQQRFRHAFSAPVGARAGSALAGARHVLTVVGCRRARAPFLAWHTPHAGSTAPRSAATAKFWSHARRASSRASSHGDSARSAP